MKKKNFTKLNKAVNLKVFSILGILTLVGILTITFITQFITPLSIGIDTPLGCIGSCGGGGGGSGWTITANEVFTHRIISNPLQVNEGTYIARDPPGDCSNGWVIRVWGGGSRMVPLGSEVEIQTFLNAASGLGITFTRITLWETSCSDDDGNGNGECLLYDSIILMSDGTEKIIQDVKVGEFVKGMNKNGEIVNTKVLDVLLDHQREGYYFINGELKITNDHPVLVEDLWIPVSQLKIGDEIKSEIGAVKIKTIKYINTPEITAHLETEIGNFLTKGEAGGTYLVKGWKSY